MCTNKTTSTDNTLSQKVPGYEKIKISTRKMEMSPKNVDDA